MHYVITEFPIKAQIGPFETRDKAEAFNLTLEDAEGFSLIDTDLNMTPEQYAAALAAQTPAEYNAAIKADGYMPKGYTGSQTDDELDAAFKALDKESMAERLDALEELMPLVRLHLSEGRARAFFEVMQDIILTAGNLDTDE
jgi:hypothetical protein